MQSSSRASPGKRTEWVQKARVRTREDSVELNDVQLSSEPIPQLRSIERKVQLQQVTVQLRPGVLPPAAIGGSGADSAQQVTVSQVGVGGGIDNLS